MTITNRTEYTNFVSIAKETGINQAADISLDCLADILLGDDDDDETEAEPNVSDKITLHWKWNKIEHVVEFATLDDAKDAYQALYTNGIAAGYSVPVGYQEPISKRYAGDGVLSDAEMAALQAQLDQMVLIH